jgi:regulation of enolase protein 1 (concanavalin A-like superfamily)
MQEDIETPFIDRGSRLEGAKPPPTKSKILTSKWFRRGVGCFLILGILSAILVPIGIYVASPNTAEIHQTGQGMMFPTKSDWRWIREAPESWKSDGSCLELEGLAGSIYGTPEFQEATFGQKSPLVQNILLNSAPLKESVSVNVEFTPKIFGAQAGIVLYVDDDNYIKLVLEGNQTGGSMIVLGKEVNGEPNVVGKVDAVAFTKSVSLKISVSGLVVTAMFQADQGEWQTVETSGEVTMVEGSNAGLIANGFGDRNQWVSLRNFSLA